MKFLACLVIEFMFAPKGVIALRGIHWPISAIKPLEEVLPWGRRRGSTRRTVQLPQRDAMGMSIDVMGKDCSALVVLKYSSGASVVTPLRLCDVYRLDAARTPVVVLNRLPRLHKSTANPSWPQADRLRLEKLALRSASSMSNGDGCQNCGSSLANSRMSASTLASPTVSAYIIGPPR
jgi:hypothetical protein